MAKTNKKVMVFGTFAILHPGHLSFFWQAKNYGDYLIVVVARDKNVEKIKGLRPKMDEKARLKMVKALKLVDQVIMGELNNRYKVILKYKPDVICLGYDQSVPRDFESEINRLKIKAKIIRLKPFKPKKYKSSKILKK